MFQSLFDVQNRRGAIEPSVIYMRGGGGEGEGREESRTHAEGGGEEGRRHGVMEGGPIARRDKVREHLISSWSHLLDELNIYLSKLFCSIPFPD